MNNQEIINELLIALKAIRSEAESPNTNVKKIHRKADEAITMAETH